MIEIKTYLVTGKNTICSVTDKSELEKHKKRLFFDGKLNYINGFIGIKVNNEPFLDESDFDYVFWMWTNIMDSLESIVFSKTSTEFFFPDQPRKIILDIIDPYNIMLIDFNDGEQSVIKKTLVPFDEFIISLCKSGIQAFVSMRDFVGSYIEEYIKKFGNYIIEIEKTSSGIVNP